MDNGLRYSLLFPVRYANYSSTDSRYIQLITGLVACIINGHFKIGYIAVATNLNGFCRAEFMARARENVLKRISINYLKSKRRLIGNVIMSLA